MAKVNGTHTNVLGQGVPKREQACTHTHTRTRNYVYICGLLAPRRQTFALFANNHAILCSKDAAVISVWREVGFVTFPNVRVLQGKSDNIGIYCNILYAV